MISLDRGEHQVLSWLAPASFLNGERWREVLAPAFQAEGFRLDAVTINYVRAKRAQSVLLGIQCAGTAADGRPSEVRGALYVSAGGVFGAESKARTLRLVPPVMGPSVASFGTPEKPWCLYLAFPNDRALRGLSAGADSRRLGNRLRGPAFNLASEGWRVRARSTVIELVRWKPGRRAVLRARLRLRHDASGRSESRTAYVRAYPGGAAPEMARRWRAAAGNIDITRSPELLGFDHERGLLLTAERPGIPWAVAANNPGPWHAVGDTLQRLHARDAALLGGSGRSDAAELAFGRGVLRDLGAWAPGLAARADALRRRLESMACSLRPAGFSPLHGDLGMDQVLLDGAELSLIDWDESTVGDPHWDAASLAADAERRGRTGPQEGSEVWAASLLGSAFDLRRWRWSVGIEHARRALATLQSGGRDWEADAIRALERAESATDAPARKRRPGAARSHSADLPTLAFPEFLAGILNPARRSRLFGQEMDDLTLAALWPERDGVSLRFDRTSATGRPALWYRRTGSDLDRWSVPEDPAMPHLARLAGASGWRLVGHRLGRRAALAAADPQKGYLHLRPCGRVADALSRLQSVERSVRGSGVTATASLPLEEGGGWRQAALPGNVIDPTLVTPRQWAEIGVYLARTHAARLPAVLPTRCGLESITAAHRQVAVSECLSDSCSRWLRTRWSEDSKAAAALGPGTPRVLIHGDLHPGQILWGEGPAFVDWERAAIGEPEEDLGNLAAHLYWILEHGAGSAWQAIREGYIHGGGSLLPIRFRVHARVALCRILAIHAWRDADRPSVLAGINRWDAWPKEISRW